MTTFESLSVVISFLGFAGLIFGLFVAKNQLESMAKSVEIAHAQLKNMAESVRISQVNTVLQIEDSIGRFKQRLDEVAIETASMGDKALAKLKLDAAVENYLNPFDRLCSLFLRGAVAETDYKKDYRDAVNTVVKNYKDYFGGVEKRHSNILKVYEKWRDE